MGNFTFITYPGHCIPHFILASQCKSHVRSRRRPIPFIDIRPNVAAVLGGWWSILGRRSIDFISFLRLFFEAPTTSTAMT